MSEAIIIKTIYLILWSEKMSSVSEIAIKNSQFVERFFSRTPLFFKGNEQVALIGLSALLSVSIIAAIWNRGKNAQVNHTLLDCARHRDLAGLRRLLLLQDVDTRDDNTGDTALIAAARNGHFGIVSELLNANALTEMTQKATGETALHVACAGGHSRIVTLLVKNRADVNARASDGTTPLMKAAENGATLCLDELFNIEGVDRNAQDNKGHTALHLSIKHPAAVEKLVNAGCVACLKDETGATPLHIAIAENLSVSMDHLLKKSESLNERDSTGRTPFYCAVESNQFSVVKKMMAIAEVDLNLANNDGVSPLHLAIEDPEKQKMAHFLINHDRCDVDISGQNGDTAAHIVARLGDQTTLRKLKEKGAILNAANDSGETPLHIIISKDLDPSIFADEMVKEDLEGIRMGELSLIEYAIVEQKSQVVKFLNEKGVFFKLSPERLPALKEAMRRVLRRSLEYFFEHSPTNVTEITLLAEELDGQRVKGELSEQVDLSIDHYLEQCAIEGKYKELGTHSEESHLFGEFSFARKILYEVLGDRVQEFFTELPWNKRKLPLIGQTALTSMSWDIGKVIGTVLPFLRGMVNFYTPDIKIHFEFEDKTPEREEQLIPVVYFDGEKIEDIKKLPPRLQEAAKQAIKDTDMPN